MTVRELRKALRGTNPDAHILFDFKLFDSGQLVSGEYRSDVSVHEDNIVHDDGSITPRIVICFDKSVKGATDEKD